MQNFGEKKRQFKLERGQGPGGPGPPPLARKYAKHVAAAEKVFATAMPVEAARYVEELATKEPEECPAHGRVLRCPAPGCGTVSQRTSYDHRAAAYLFDRIMGRPTSSTASWGGPPRAASRR